MNEKKSGVDDSKEEMLVKKTRQNRRTCGRYKRSRKYRKATSMEVKHSIKEESADEPDENGYSGSISSSLSSVDDDRQKRYKCRCPTEDGTRKKGQTTKVQRKRKSQCSVDRTSFFH